MLKPKPIKIRFSCFSKTYITVIGSHQESRAASHLMLRSDRSYRHFEESDGVVNEVAEAISRAMVVDHRSMVGLVGKAANRGDNEQSD